MKERTQLAIKLIVSHIILMPGLILITLLSTNYPFFILGIAQAFLGILYFAGYWEFFLHRFKKYFCGVMEVIILLLFIWKFSSVQEREVNPFMVILLSLVLFYLLYTLIKIIRVIYEQNSFAVEIEFPFRKGNYLVTDGGNSRISRLMNYHYHSVVHKRNKTNNSMLYAVDIVKVKGNKLNFLPKRNEDYPIFNERLYSPMDGVVVKVVNGLSDNEPYSGNYPYNTGNTVVIKKDNLYLLLGHLKKDSIAVKEGDSVQSNALIGSAGNSGWTERPHLHMQLIKSDSDNYWLGQGVCSQYRNRNLYKNRWIKI